MLLQWVSLHSLSVPTFMFTQYLSPLFSPNYVAIVGASAREGALERFVMENMLADWFKSPAARRSVREEAADAGDAAFYWQQRDQSVHSPLIGLQALAEVDWLLDGVRVATDDGWRIALTGARRRKSASPASFPSAAHSIAQIAVNSGVCFTLSSPGQLGLLLARRVFSRADDFLERARHIEFGKVSLRG
jgi:hypothetical protein